MAIVPQISPGSVQRRGINAPLATAASFGAGDAQALGNIAQGLGDVASEFDREVVRQQVTVNQNTTRDALAKARQEANAALAEHQNNKSGAATGGTEALDVKMEEIRSKYKDNLPNQHTKDMFESSYDDMASANSAVALRHEFQENKVHEVETRDAENESFLEASRLIAGDLDATDNWNEYRMLAIANEAKNNPGSGDLQGIAFDVSAAFVKAGVQKLMASSPAKALAFLETMKPEDEKDNLLRGTTYNAMLKQLQSVADRDIGSSFSRGLRIDNPGMTTGEINDAIIDPANGLNEAQIGYARAENKTRDAELKNEEVVLAENTITEVQNALVKSGGKDLSPIDEAFLIDNDMAYLIPGFHKFAATLREGEVKTGDNEVFYNSSMELLGLGPEGVEGRQAALNRMPSEEEVAALSLDQIGTLLSMRSAIRKAQSDTEAARVVASAMSEKASIDLFISGHPELEGMESEFFAAFHILKKVEKDPDAYKDEDARLLVFETLSKNVRWRGLKMRMVDALRAGVEEFTIDEIPKAMQGRVGKNFTKFLVGVTAFLENGQPVIVSGFYNPKTQMLVDLETENEFQVTEEPITEEEQADRDEAFRRYKANTAAFGWLAGPALAGNELLGGPENIRAATEPPLVTLLRLLERGE